MGRLTAVARGRYGRAGLALGLALSVACAGPVAPAPAPLTVDDFRFDGPLGSAGAAIEQTGPHRFKVTLGAAPEQPGWPNKLNVHILRHARGNPLQLDVSFPDGTDYAFNEYHQSFSYDATHWQPIAWDKGYLTSPLEDTLNFPPFTGDEVFIGTQVPMSWDDALALIDRWRTSPHVTVYRVGETLGGRDMVRLEITANDSPHPRASRWVHYFANQHPGEHNSQWRLVGLVDWLLSDAAADVRARQIVHVVLMMSPDAPSNGWYRVNAQGVDMNRSYRAEGADAQAQAHEAFIWQRDLETLMNSDAPVTTMWAIHTWPGIVEPRITPGPEFGSRLGSWEDLRATLSKTDRLGLIEPLTRAAESQYGGTSWTDGPHAQFGITAVLCEGGAVLQTRALNEASGATIMQALGSFYSGLRDAPTP